MNMESHMRRFLSLTSHAFAEYGLLAIMIAGAVPLLAAIIYCGASS